MYDEQTANRQADEEDRVARSTGTARQSSSGELSLHSDEGEARFCAPLAATRRPGVHPEGGG